MAPFSRQKEQGVTKEEHTLDSPEEAIATESPVTATPIPPVLRKTCAEHTHPEQAAEYIMLTVEDPLASALSKAKKTGLPEAAARGLEKRIRTRYAEALEEITPVTKEALEKRLSRRLDVIAGFLSDDMLESKLTEARLKDLGVYEGIMMTKLHELRGMPSIIIKTEDGNKLDDIAKALVDEIARRGKPSGSKDGEP